MKLLFAGTLVALTLSGFAYPQDATPQPQPQPPETEAPQTQSASATTAPRFAPGSIIPVQLTKTIDTKKVKKGDQVEAKVTQDLKSASGQVVVPKDTKVVGHVTEAEAANQNQKESQLGIAFDHAVIKNGPDVSMPMSIQAIIAPWNPNSGNNGAAAAAGPSASESNSGGMPPGNVNRSSSGMGNAPAPTPPSGNDVPTAQTTPDARPVITTHTQGVVGIPNLTLSPAADATQGSVVSSGKGSVKLESGTLMLLRVNP